ncbi:MAG TPA: HTH domain-containing protein, partial [Petrotogaceae bacterium]|nr:HTH domain-containing protein [Petrotogaceae bacterium]
MEKTLRQKKVLESISSSTDPVSGSELALKFGVTRQIIVRDVMILKAQGEDIRSNSRGYYIN